MDLKKRMYCCILVVSLLIQGIRSYDPDSSITGLYTGPYFDPLAKRNLSAHLGDQASLPCTVRQLGDKSVSWVRMRDADILTVDRYTFVGDERFESHYSEAKETWSLIIKYVQERDAGLYECQVSTEPKMSQLFSLRVVSPKVSIMPPGDKYMKAGSRVQIDCLITSVVQLPDYIFWYHGDKRMMENKEPNILITVKETGFESITSTLTILEVPSEANGNYTCMPSNLHAASVNLHVLNEKHPEAMQGERNGTCSLTGSFHLRLLLLFLLFLLMCQITPADFNIAPFRTTQEVFHGKAGDLLLFSNRKDSIKQTDHDLYDCNGVVAIGEHLFPYSSSSVPSYSYPSLLPLPTLLHPPFSSSIQSSTESRPSSVISASASPSSSFTIIYLSSSSTSVLHIFFSKSTSRVLSAQTRVKVLDILKDISDIKAEKEIKDEEDLDLSTNGIYIINNITANDTGLHNSWKTASFLGDSSNTNFSAVLNRCINITERNKLLFEGNPMEHIINPVIMTGNATDEMKKLTNENNCDNDEKRLLSHRYSVNVLQRLCQYLKHRGQT